jgi:hypothetical protein
MKVDYDKDQLAYALANALKERDEARELHRKALSEREATEKEVDAMLERSLKAERERDEAREENANLRDIAERAIDYLDQSYRGGFADEASDLRYEFKQLTKESK